MKKFIFGLIFGIALGVGTSAYLSKAGLFIKEETFINEEVLKEKLLTCSELTSAKYQLKGHITRTKNYGTKLKWFDNISTKSFTVRFSATLAFAVDLSKANNKVDTNTVRSKIS